VHSRGTTPRRVTKTQQRRPRGVTAVLRRN